MKKIIFSLTLLLTAGLIQAQQQTAAFGANAKVMSAEEANRLNGMPATTINGKPYSQYKAEQDALKLQEANRVATVKSSNSGLTNMPTQSKTAPVENKPGKDEMGPKPVVTSSVVKTDVKPVETKTVATVSNLPGNFHNVPATTEQQKVAEVQNLKGTSADPNATVQTETVKVVAPAPDKAVTTEKPASRPADSVKDKKD